jgi:DNA-directed RNA polymerase beta subunit
MHVQPPYSMITEQPLAGNLKGWSEIWEEMEVWALKQGVLYFTKLLTI